MEGGRDSCALPAGGPTWPKKRLPAFKTKKNCNGKLQQKVVAENSCVKFVHIEKILSLKGLESLLLCEGPPSGSMRGEKPPPSPAEAPDRFSEEEEESE